MLDACAEIQGGGDGLLGGRRSDAVSRAERADCDDSAALAQLDQAERRAAQSLEASKAAITVHIQAFSDRLARAESHLVALSPRVDAVADVDGSSVGSPQVPREEKIEDDRSESDPDKRQQKYAEFLALTKKNMNCVSVHNWSMWASKLDSQDFDSLPSRYDASAYAALTAADLPDTETLWSAVSHCETTDGDPDRCDFIVAFHEQFTVAAFVVLVSTICIMLGLLITDMDKQVQVAEVFEHRITNLATTSTLARGSITGMGLLILNMRRFVLPGVVVYTYAALVLAPARDASLPVSYVLNGLAIGFVYNVDALLAAAFLDTAAQALPIQAFADMDAHVYGGAKPVVAEEVLFGFHRFLVICFAALVFGCVLGTEGVMSSFRLDWDEIPTKWVENPSGRSCTNVMTMLCSTAVIVAAFLALLWSMTRYASKTSNRCGRSGFLGLIDVIVSPVSVLVTMPMFSYVLLKLGHTVML